MAEKTYTNIHQQPFVLVIFGLPGTGKSSLAEGVSDELGIPFYNTDRIRSELDLRDNYSGEVKDRVYRVLMDKAAESLVAGSPVIIDGTFHKVEKREEVIRLSKKLNVPVLFVECRADEETIQQRTGQKRKFSQADFEVYKKVKAAYEPPEKVDLILDTAKGSIRSNVSAIIDLLKNKEWIY